MFSTLATTTVLGPWAPDNYEGGPLEGWDTCYYAIYGGDRALNARAVEEPIGDPGIITKFAAGVNAAPSVGEWTFTLMRGDLPLASCTVGGEKRKCSADTYTQVTALDKLSIRMVQGSGDSTPLNMFSAAAFQIKYLVQ
jgi:hypothetical protein